MRGLRLLPLWLCACAAGPAPAAPPSGVLPVPPDGARARAAASEGPLDAAIDPIFAAYASGRAPGCAVGVYRAGEVAFARGYGLADPEHDAHITETTPFVLASISKQLTATAVVLLAQDGKLSLDDDVRTYVPELHDVGARVTIAHLLHHTSGVRDYGLLLELAGQADGDLVTNDQVLALLARQRSLDFAPGSRFQYSNSGYVLLSIIAQRVSGMPLAELLRARVFAPLGMLDTFVRDDHTRLVPGRALGVVRAPDGAMRLAVPSSETTGPGNVVSTVRDLARWDANFYAPRVGGQALLEALRRPGRLADGTSTGYGMGLFVDDTRGVHRELHDGATGGYRATLVRYPGERVGVAVLCNDASAEPAKLAERVAAVFVPSLREAAPPPATSPAPAPAVGPGVTGAAADYVGRYGSEELVRDLTIEARAGALAWQPLGSARGREALEPSGRDTFRVQGDDLTMSFERDARGRVRGLVLDTPRTHGLRLERRHTPEARARPAASRP